MFEIGNIMAIYLVERPETIFLGKYKYQHKFLYIMQGSGLVRLDNNLFNFCQGSSYAFRIAGSIELVSANELAAVVIIFNTIPFPDNKTQIDLARQLSIVDKIVNLMPITSQIHEYQVQNQQDQESVSALLQIIKREMLRQLEHSYEIILNNALNIVSIAVRVSPNVVNREVLIGQTPEISRVIDYIQDKLRKNKKLTISEIAEGVSISEYILNRMFIKSAGITFANYLRKTKSELASDYSTNQRISGQIWFLPE